MGEIRSLLLQLDGTAPSSARLDFARRLALAHGARLWALYAGAPPRRPVQLALSESPAALLQPTPWADMERVRAMFDEARGLGGPAMEWLEPAGDAVPAFTRQALCADLLVLGQAEPDGEAAGGAPAGFVESVLIGSGKPALVLPYAGRHELAGGAVLVGWNATPAAARAVAAALTWLRAARRVHVMLPAEEERPGGIDIADYLQCHGIAPELHRRQVAAGGAGDALLSCAGDVGAELLVMGCYGHSRARELILGGASRTVLHSMTLPVLMAH